MGKEPEIICEVVKEMAAIDVSEEDISSSEYEYSLRYHDLSNKDLKRIMHLFEYAAKENPSYEYFWNKLAKETREQINDQLD